MQIQNELVPVPSLSRIPDHVSVLLRRDGSHKADRLLKYNVVSSNVPGTQSMTPILVPLLLNKSDGAALDHDSTQDQKADAYCS